MFSTRAPAILTKDFRRFPQSLQDNEEQHLDYTTTTATYQTVSNSSFIQFLILTTSLRNPREREKSSGF